MFCPAKPKEMQAKKNLLYNLESKRVQLFFLGLLCSCAVVLTAFEWRTFDREIIPGELVFTDYLPMEPIPPVPPQKKNELSAPKKQQIEKFILVDEMREQEELFFPEMETEQPEIIEIEDMAEHVPEPEIKNWAEVMPSFPGGDQALYAFLRANLRYPPKARDAGIQGAVWIQFVVDKEGKISEIEILRGIGGGCDEESIRVLQAMPTWTPGRQAGRNVAVRYKMPLKYTLKR